jgi:hypothetical protein
VCDLETSRIGAPYIYNVRLLRVNTETCRSNFKINLHQLSVPMLVHNKHLFVNMLQDLAMNCTLTYCSKRPSHISLQGRWEMYLKQREVTQNQLIQFHHTRASYKQGRHRWTAQSDCQGVLHKLKIRSRFFVARPCAVPSNEFKVQGICNNQDEIMWDEFVWFRTRTSGALLWTR